MLSSRAFRTLLAAALVFGLAGPALADAACDAQFLAGKRPVAAQHGTVELCNDHFADIYDPTRRTLVFAAEHLTYETLMQARDVDRANAFHPDPRLTPEQGARVKDYVGSGYDKGHMAPDADMPTPEAKRQSDSLANVVPQDPTNNRGLWAHLEKATRAAVVPAHEGWVVSGPIFDGEPKLMADRIPVPTRLFKAFYRPIANNLSDSYVGVWVVHNASDGALEEWSLDRFKQETGIDLFPGLSAADHARIDLPTLAKK